MSFKSLALTIAAIAICCISTANAQQGCRSIVLPNGTVLTCEVVNGQKVYVDNLGNTYPATSTGVGDFKIVNTTTNPCVAELDVTNINVTSTNGALGTVTTTLDPTRLSPRSRIRSNSVASEFPATEDIFFYAQATISSRPGRVYRSFQPVHLNSPNVKTFNPHNNEVFNLVGKVDFYDINVPNVVAFTLTTLKVTLTGRQG
jgi:hypothetical protein